MFLYARVKDVKICNFMLCKLLRTTKCSLLRVTVPIVQSGRGLGLVMGNV